MAANPPTPIKHVFVVYLENSSLSQTLTRAPYLRSLWDEYGKATKYYGVCYPSAPNYLAFACGKPLQCGSDSCHPGLYPEKNLVDLLEQRGLAYTLWAESATAECPAGNEGDFACRHYPWTYFKSVFGTARCANLKPIADLVADFPYADTPPAFTWLGANVLNDGHNTGIAYADRWAAKFFPKLMAQTWFADSILFVTTDTGRPRAGYSAGGQSIEGGQVYTVAVSPFSKGKKHSADATHYNLAASVMEILGLPAPLGNAGTAAFPPLRSLWT